MDANSKLQALRSSVVSLNPRRSMQEPNLWQGRAHIVFAEFLPQNTFLFRLPFGTWISWRNRVFQCGFNVFHVFCLWRAVSCTSKRPRPQEVQRRLGAEWHGMTETIRPLSPQVFFKTNWWGINGSDDFLWFFDFYDYFLRFWQDPDHWGTQIQLSKFIAMHGQSMQHARWWMVACLNCRCKVT